MSTPDAPPAEPARSLEDASLGGAAIPARPDPALLARLSALGVRIGVPAVPATPAPRPNVLPIEAAVPGRSVESAHGRCYISTAVRAVDDRHGGTALGDVLAAPIEGVLALGSRRAVSVDPCRTAFLDTETTGLAGGTGTYAFLVGVGRFVDGSFQVRQFFMRDPSEERAQLAEVAAWVADCSDLVTFNGRTFDVPLLGARYALHRMQTPLSGLGHLDLLPVARRIWRRRLDSCALTSLERHVLGFVRQDDVPGWLIPERYFRYQRDGDARPLVGIFRHNVFDILSMVALLSHVALVGARPDGALHHAVDWLSLALAHELRHDWNAVVHACEGALARGLPPVERDDALLRMARACRRRGDWERAVTVWTDLTAPDAPRRLAPFEELAKYHEHHRRPPDLAFALEVTERARALVDDGVLRPRRGRAAALSDLDHRAARLRRRMGGG